MKVLYDYQAFCLQRFGGISNYFVQIIKNLPSNIQYEIAVSDSNNIHLRDSELVSIPCARQTMESFITRRHYRGKSWLYNRCSSLFPNWTSLGKNRNKAIEFLKGGQFDVFHPTFYSDYFLPYLNGKPYVITVHDMIPELFPSEFDKRNEQLLNKAKLVLKAAHVLTVSEKTKEDLISILNIPDDKVTVIYHGAPTNISKDVIKPLVRGKYILFVGNRGGYKNFMPMIKALVPILKIHRELNVVCTGNSFCKKEKQIFKEYCIEDQLIHIQPNDMEILNLYKNALCFIFPSMYEGFGIPILEAWKADCPVLLNKKSCFPEVAGEAAVYFNVDNDHSDLTEVMDQFLSMSEYEKSQLIQNQRNRLKLYSWKKSAEQLTNVYQMIL